VGEAVIPGPRQAVLQAGDQKAGRRDVEFQKQLRADCARVPEAVVHGEGEGAVDLLARHGTGNSGDISRDTGAEASACIASRLMVCCITLDGSLQADCREPNDTPRAGRESRGYPPIVLLTSADGALSSP
jgi:hypothetical protein